LPTGLSSLRDEAADASSPEASIPSRVSEVLDRAADLLTPEGAWTQGLFARDVTGYPLPAGFDAGAVCWCAVGAIEKVTGEECLEDLPVLAAQQLESVLPTAIPPWNDAPERTQEEVVAKLREAAALAREQGK